MISNDILASGYFSSVSSTISSTALIVFRIYNSVSNQDGLSKKQFMHTVVDKQSPLIWYLGKGGT